MNDPDTSYTSIPRDRALVAVDSDASPGASAERARAWRRDVALRVRHDEGLDPDTGQPRRRCPLPLVTQDLTAITDPATARYDVDEEWPLDDGINRGQWRRWQPAQEARRGEIVVVDPDGAARSGLLQGGDA